MKLAFITAWIQFYEAHKEEFSDDLYRHKDLVPFGHFFISRDRYHNYVYVFNNNIKKTYYTIQFNSKLNLYGPYSYDDVDDEQNLPILKLYSDNLDYLYSTMIKHQNRIDLKLIGNIINYRPYNGGKEDLLYTEFKHIINSIGPKTMTIQRAKLLQLDLKQEEIIVCNIPEKYTRMKIFQIITHLGIYSLVFYNKLLITPIENDHLLPLKEFIPFTFKDKILVNPVPSLQALAGVGAAGTKEWLPKHIDCYRK